MGSNAFDSKAMVVIIGFKWRVMASIVAVTITVLVVANIG